MSSSQWKVGWWSSVLKEQFSAKLGTNITKCKVFVQLHSKHTDTQTQSSGWKINLNVKKAWFILLTKWTVWTEQCNHQLNEVVYLRANICATVHTVTLVVPFFSPWKLSSGSIKAIWGCNRLRASIDWSALRRSMA